MGLHIKSTRTFKMLIGFSALSISIIAATFSVTGIATLFSGYFLTVALMMGALEFAKIVVASFLARYWIEISKLLRTYFIIALTVLILITSGGIFGYLSDGYQKNKGDYTLIEKQVEVLKVKQNSFIERKNRLEANRQLEMKIKQSNQTRADSLTARGQSISRTRNDILNSDKRIADYDKQISSAEDSISSYDVNITTLEAKNIQGELGPLKYISSIFNSNMDNVVKYFILLLIFVFDPLAILLYVSLNIIIRKESLVDDDGADGNTQEHNAKNSIDEEKKESKISLHNEYKDSKDSAEKNIIKTNDIDVQNNTEQNSDTDSDNTKIEDLKEENTKNDEIKNLKSDSNDEFVNEIVNKFEESEPEPEKINIIPKIEGEPKPPTIQKKSANYHP